MDNNNERQTLTDWINVLTEWMNEAERKRNILFFNACETHIKFLNEVIDKMKGCAH
jgi:hypothetical protein